MAMNFKKFSAASLIVGALLAPGFAGAGLDNNKNVFDARDNTVMDARGNCVLTKWQGADHKCGGKKAAPQLSLAQRTIYFNFNSAELTPAAKKKLEYIVMVAKSSDAIVSASVIGHADRIGDAAYNQQLSARRAKAAQAYLARLGFDATSIGTVAARGENAPVSKGCGDTANSKNISCLQPDRRVEVQLKYKQ